MKEPAGLIENPKKEERLAYGQRQGSSTLSSASGVKAMKESGRQEKKAQRNEGNTY